MKKLLLLLGLLISFTLQSQTWTARPRVSMTSGTNGFYEWLPAGYNGVTKFPVIIFIHGLSECGDGDGQLDDILGLALPQKIQNSGFPYGAIVLCPQISSPWPGGNTIEGIINYARNNYASDTTRIYLTGLSMGGGAILDWADVGNVYKVAAMAPVCPSSVWQSFGVKYKNFDMPFWFFHGDADGVVNISASNSWITNLNASPTIVPRARMDTMVGQGHNIWNTVYDYGRDFPGLGMDVYELLLSQQRTNYTGIPSSGGGGSPPPSDTIRVNVGGTTDVYQEFKYWKKLDEAQVSGGLFTDVMAIWGVDQTITNSGPQDSIVYKSARLATSGYAISYPISNGTYTVRLHFCEFWRNAAGVNVFNVLLEGTQVITNLDIWTAAGGRYRAYSQDFTVTISDGNLSIQGVKINGDAMLNGFEVWPATASNVPPIANAGSDRTITLPNNQTSLFGSGSSDPDGSITGYQWTTISGPGGSAFTTPTQSSTTFYNLVAGTYQVELTVTDNGGATDKDTVVVTVNPAPNTPPTVSLGANTFTVLPKDSVVLTATASDLEGTVTGYQYLKISGTGGSFRSPTTASTALYGLTPGTYQVRVIATDNGGLSASDTIVITVYPPVNTPPVVNAGANQTITLPLDSVQLNGVVTDAVGTITSYLWTATPSAGVVIRTPANDTTRVVFPSAGNYTLRLTATDDSSATVFDETLITVNPTPGLSYVTNVYQIYHNPTYQIAAMVTFDDGTSLKVFNHSGSPVRRIAKRMQVVDGATRPVAYIWFNDGFTRVITKKGE